MAAFLTKLDRATSTNDVLRKMVEDGASDGRGVYTTEQTAGRGRRGRKWVCPEGTALALSVAIVGPQHHPYMLQMPLAVGVAVADVIREATELTPQLKWPNDVLIDGKKVAGILCEGVHDGARLRGVIVGVGLNVNVPTDEFPDELRSIATSMHAAAGDTYEVAPLAHALYGAIIDRISLLAADRGALLDLWRRHDVTKGRGVRIGELTGTAAGINADGALLVDTNAGQRAVRSGEIEWVAD